MKEKSLSFPFISFSESGLFNDLRPIQIKNYSCPSAQFRSSKTIHLASSPGRGMDPMKKIHLAHISGIGNDLLLRWKLSVLTPRVLIPTFP
jgi:hypothetical protein